MRSVRPFLIAGVVWAGGWGLAVGLPADEPPPKAPRFKSELLEERDKITATVGKDGVTFDVSGGRAGRADITLAEGTWPADITVRVRRTHPPEFMFEADNGSVKLFGKFNDDREQSDEKRKILTNPTVRWFDAKGKSLDKLSGGVKYAMTSPVSKGRGSRSMWRWCCLRTSVIRT